MQQVDLLPWNLRALTHGSCLPSILSFDFLSSPVLCFHSLSALPTCSPAFFVQTSPTNGIIRCRNVTACTVCLFLGCLSSQQHAIVSQGRICSDNFTCCHTEIEVADQTVYLTQSQYTDTGPTSPSADPITPGAWQGSHWSANF